MNPADDGPVTVLITRLVRRGREADYEAWLGALQAAARGLPGYLGVTTQRPAPGAPREYTSIVRFATLAHLRAFEGSELRAQHLAALGDIAEAEAGWQTLTGLEFWFTPPPGTAVPQPVRWRMAVVMVAVVFALVLSIGSAVTALFGFLPAPLRLLLTITLEVLLMTYWLMPRLTRWLARWIYPQPSRRDREPVESPP